MDQEKKTHFQEIAKNRKAFFQYEILEKFEMGIVLTGTEVKSLRACSCSIEEAYVSSEKGELWLVNASIPPYKFGSIYNHEEKRKRKLLAHSREIATIDGALTEKGQTCVPLSMFFKDGICKVQIAICKGKKLYDKREAIKEREEKKQLARMMKKFT